MELGLVREEKSLSREESISQEVLKKHDLVVAQPF
jgi:hypothetical protein